MKPLTLSFTTFLKICSKRARGKVGEVRRFTQGGGYDFYKQMKLIAADLAKHRISFGEAGQKITAISRDSERAHTLAAIHKLQDFLATNQMDWHEPISGHFRSASGLLRVKLEPELAFKRQDGAIECLYIWNLSRPELTTQLAGEGLWLLADELGKPDVHFGILDLRRKAVMSESVITAASGPQLNHDLLLIEQIWKDLHGPSFSVDDTVARIEAGRFLVRPSP